MTRRAQILAWSLLGAACHAESSFAPEPALPLRDALSAIATAALPSPATPVLASARDSARPTEPPATNEPARRGRALLLTLDGVRWQDMARGLDTKEAAYMPCLHAQMEKWGTAIGLQKGCGAVVASGPSFVSLPGYREIFTGQPARCGSNVCPPLKNATLFDALHDADVPASELVSVSSWEDIAKAVSQNRDAPAVLSLLAGARARAPAFEAHDATLRALLDEGGRHAGTPGTTRDYRPDLYTADIGMRMWTEHQPRFLHIGLGDADEYAHRNDLTHYHRALSRSDRLICDIGARLALEAEVPDAAPTLVVVTADHGRATNFRDHGAAYPESARSFVVAFGSAVTTRGSQCAPHDVALGDIAPMLARTLGVSFGRGPEGEHASANTLLATLEPLPSAR